MHVICNTCTNILHNRLVVYFNDISGTAIQELARGLKVALIAMFTRIVHFCHDQVVFMIKASNPLESSTFGIQAAFEN